MTHTSALNRYVRSTISNELRDVRSMGSLPTALHYALVGQLLSDGSAGVNSSTSKTARITWSFGSDFQLYGEFIATLFSNYCNPLLYAVSVRAVVNGVKYTNYRLKTVSLSVFRTYFDMFYVENTTTGKYSKVVPINIMELMHPITLAHLIMGDGNFDTTRNRVRIYTNSFTHADCLRLAESITALGIQTSVIFDRVGKNGENQYILIIPGSQLSVLQQMVSSHMHSSMLYRVGL